MQKKYEAIQTAVLTAGETLPDIVAGRFYQADKQNEYFINEYGETVYLSGEKFSEYFRAVNITKAGQTAKKKYRKANTVALSLRLFYGVDDDIIKWLDRFHETAEEKKLGTRNGKSEYIRTLIRQDMKQNKM